MGSIHGARHAIVGVLGVSFGTVVSEPGWAAGPSLPLTVVTPQLCVTDPIPRRRHQTQYRARDENEGMQQQGQSPTAQGSGSA